MIIQLGYCKHPAVYFFPVTRALLPGEGLEYMHEESQTGIESFNKCFNATRREEEEGGDLWWLVTSP